MLVLGTLVLLVSCTDPAPPLTPLAGDGLRLEGIARLEVDGWGVSRRLPFGAGQEASPAGAELFVLRGEGFTADHVVWLGESLVYQDKIDVSADGRELIFMAPATLPGVTLDVGVGLVDPFTEEAKQRAVLPGAWTTSGLSSGAVGWLLIGIGALALIGAPLYVVIAAVTMLGLYLDTQLAAGSGFFTRINPSGLIDKPGKGVGLIVSWVGPSKMGDTPLFVAIPLFTFAGTLLSESHSPTRLINLCRAFIGWLPGGLAWVTLVTCCFFTAFTGASGVTIIALGGLLFPILLREGYPERFSLGLLTTGGSLGLLFPPSLPVIVYGLITRLDVKRLFQACLFPGLLLVALLGVTCFLVALQKSVPRHTFTWAEVKDSVRAGAWDILLPILVVGGIYMGVFSATEASAVAATYVLFTTVVVYRDLALAEVFRVVRKTAVLVGAILLIMGAALGFSDWLDLVQIPQKILAAMQAHVSGQLTFLLMLNVFLLVVGCLMDIFSAILVVVPLIAPVALNFGVDPYHLAAIFLVNLEIGYSTPPVGINLFIASLRFGRPVFALYRASVLFIGVLLVALVLITYFPFITLGTLGAMPTIVLDEAPVTAVQYEDQELAPLRVGLGELTLADARDDVSDAEAGLAAEEKRRGVDYRGLKSAQLDAQAVLEDADQVDAHPRAREQLAQLETQLAPFAEVEARLAAARKLVSRLEELQRKIRWRSRLDGTEAVGATFSTGLLAPGTHLLTATATDPETGHVSQATIQVIIQAAPDEGAGEGDDGGWGDEDDWGDEGDWGDDEGSGEQDSGDGDWGDDDWSDDPQDGSDGGAGEGD
jgi:tripartite ATP-independent transporter DctM subunit